MDGVETTQQRFDLITRRLTEINGGEAIRKIVAAGKEPKCFWATAPTGRPHIAYFVPLVKLAEFVKAGVDVTVLFCDLYAYLVNYKHPLDLVAWRTKYYRFIIAAVLESLGVPYGKVHFVDGSSYELTKQFSIDNYKLCTMVDEQDARNTGDEYRDGTRLSVLLCPGLPGLAEEYLDADFQFGGEDQRGLFAFNEHFLPKLGYRKRAHMMNAMIPGLTGTKMSSSIPDSKIDFLDPPDVVQEKIFNALCEDGVTAGNGLLALMREVLFPISQLRLDQSAAEDRRKSRPFCNEDAPEGTLFSVGIENRGRPSMKHYKTYEEVERDFQTKQLNSQLLRQAVAEAINKLLNPLRRSFEGNVEWQEVDKLAYAEG